MIRRNRYALLLAVCGSIAGLSHAQACALWSAAGVYNIRQSNGFTVSLTAFQAGTNLSGQAGYPGGSGLIEGVVTGSRMNFTIYWNDGSRGDYDGFINAAGSILGGTTYDLDNQGSNATWTTKKKLACVSN